MLKIAIEGGKTYQLEAHVPLGRVNEEGDNYGNGHIDWNPDGLFLYEIVEQISEETVAPVVGAWRDGQFLPMNYFVCRDCNLKLETAADSYGKTMWMETAELLLEYVMWQLYPTCQKVKSALPNRYVYVATQAENATVPDMDTVNQALTRLIAEDSLHVETRLMNPMKLIRRMESQGQLNGAYDLYGADCGDPVLTHEINGQFIAEASSNTTLPVHFLSGFKIDSIENQKFQNFTGYILHTKR